MENRNNFDYEEITSAYGNDGQTTIVASAFSALMRKVYVWMALALVVSGLTALYVSRSAGLLQMAGSGIWLLVIAELALVIFLTARIHKMSFQTAGIMFVLYSVLNGVTLSFIFLAYTMSSIATTFFVTAGTFAAMSLIGYGTRRDLSSMGRYLLFALIGLIIATVVNLFLGNGLLNLVISAVGVLVFVGLTAYDTQKIKQMFLMNGTDVNEGTQKLALMGSLMLYLDFINLFLYLLRFFGRSNN
ncbi:MAG: Bax inhibitor-1/YccA family protein [Bacteroidaceae bacterium]|nr:Bax inhibitor-1/YccA family protein [Bacteroidaceae bacterium]